MVSLSLILAVTFLRCFELVVGQDPEDAIKSKLYTSLNAAPCVRLLTAVGDIGCSAPTMDGTTAFMFLIEKDSDLMLFRSLDQSILRAVVLPPHYLNDTVLNQLSNSGSHFGGVLALPSPLIPVDASFSSDSILLPMGSSAPWPWNPSSRNTIQKRYNVPAFYLTDSDAEVVMSQVTYNKVQRNYASFPQYAAHFNLYMGPVGLTSVSCLSSQSCLPIGGQSVWGTLGALDAAANPPSPQRPIIMIVCPLDSSALFHNLAFGADSAASSIVALLATANALKSITGPISLSSLPYQIAFGFFQGEQWGRIGSRRWLSEVQSFSCSQIIPAANSPTGKAYCVFPPRSDLSFQSLQLSKIEYVIAVDQIGRVGLSNLFIHETDSRSSPNPNRNFISAFSQVAQAGGSSLNISPSSLTTSPPPSPLQSFQDINLKIDGAVMSAYDSTFQSRYYHSEYDNATKIDYNSIASSASLLAKVIYALALNQSLNIAVPQAIANVPPANSTFVNSMIQCITVNPQCNLFAGALQTSIDSLSSYVPASPLSLYTSVYTASSLSGSNTDSGLLVFPKPIEAVVHNLFAIASATSINGSCASTSDCQNKGIKVSECIMNSCVVGNSFFHDALSTAITQNQDSTFSTSVQAASAVDPVYTEPYWSTGIGVSVFLKDGYTPEVTVFVVGILNLLFWIGATYLLVRFLDKHYKVG
jgi:nicastrin